ncbi:MAG: MBL fold metallo-hydrolase [Longimicrobiales bacterium]|nr:MBL fold metallo-hydrolase [Longimicrobiales bacterium]
MRLTLLGTGTSFGVPVVGCDCRVCTSEDPRDRRDRSAALLDLPEGRLLIDAPPELRLHLLREGIASIDAVWITHTHADHLHGLDDLRIVTQREARSLDAWVADIHREDVEARFSYIFDDRVQPPPGTSKPKIVLHELSAGRPVRILGQEIIPVALPHGPVTSFGFRAGTLGYLTDGKSVPDAALEVLRGIDTLVINALWWGSPHPTHFNIEEAIETARTLGARRTFLVHLTHRVLHAELEADLPEGVAAGYDGLAIDFPPDDTGSG